MAQQNKTQLKTYYQTGDTPTSDQYGELIDSSLNLSETALQIGEFSVSSSGNIKMMGSASFVGDITASGDIKSSGVITCTSLDTGQGAYELYAMNQNLQTTNIVTFRGVNITKTDLSDVVFGANLTTTGQSFTVQINDVPAIGAFNKVISYTNDEVKMSNGNIAASSIIVGSTTSDLVLSIYAASDGFCKFRIGNTSTSVFNGGNVVCSFIVF